MMDFLIPYIFACGMLAGAIVLYVFTLSLQEIKKKEDALFRMNMRITALENEWRKSQK